MKLFTTMKRTDLAPKMRSNSNYEFLNSSARMGVRKVRDEIERWFQRIPATEKIDLKARFSSREKEVHLAAFFEIYLHQLFLEMGFEIFIHPQNRTEDGTCPDFLICKGGHECFFLEATVATESPDVLNERRRISLFLDTLEGIETSGFSLEVSVFNFPKDSPSSRSLRNQLTKWLSGLNHNEICTRFRTPPHGPLPVMIWPRKNPFLRFSAIPRSPEKHFHRAIGVEFDEMREVETAEKVRASVLSKGKKYRGLDGPLLLAQNIIEEIPDREDVMEGLFDPEGMRRSLNQKESLLSSDAQFPNGALISAAGPRNQKFNGILSFLNLGPFSFHVSGGDLYLNPWAKKVEQIENLELRKWRIDNKKVVLEFLGGKPANAILGFGDDYLVT